jgi:hypothetical protein
MSVINIIYIYIYIQRRATIFTDSESPVLVIRCFFKRYDCNVKMYTVYVSESGSKVEEANVEMEGAK